MKMRGVYKRRSDSESASPTFLNEKAPCDDCERAQQCAAGFACRAFDRYINNDPWEHLRRAPSRRIFRDIFVTGDT